MVQTLVSRWRELTSQGEERGRIRCLRYGVHKLLHSDKVLHIATT